MRQIGFAEASRRFKKRKGAPAPRRGSWRSRTTLAAAVLRLSGAAIMLATRGSGSFPPKSLSYPRSLMAGGGSRDWRGRGWRAGRRSCQKPGYGSRHRDALDNYFSGPSSLEARRRTEIST